MFLADTLVKAFPAKNEEEWKVIQDDGLGCICNPLFQCWQTDSKQQITSHWSFIAVFYPFGNYSFAAFAWIILEDVHFVFLNKNISLFPGTNRHNCHFALAADEKYKCNEKIL